ncbi:MAG: phosphopantetheine-binding protein [Actinomycetota bacterium]
MDTQAWVISKLAEVISVDAEELAPETRLDEDVECDSIDLIEVLNAAEDEFGIEIDEERLYDVVTVAQLAEVVDAERNAS